MNQIHSFVANNGDAYDAPSADDQDAGNLRDDLNRVNSTYTEQLRSLRSQISDEAKTLQKTLTKQAMRLTNKQTWQHHYCRS